MTRYPAIDLEGATVAITGGAQGIGRATAETFAARGATVAIGDLDLELATTTAEGIGGSAHPLDVSDRDSFADFLAAVENTHGELDILVNNAGVMEIGGFLELDDEAYDLMIDVNLRGVLHGTRLALPAMQARGRGHIVNVASLAGKIPVPGLAVYNATKYAVVGMTGAVRREAAAQGISLTAILPSIVDTELAAGLDMKPIPTVTAQQIADAIVGSVASREAEVAIPGWVGGLATAAEVFPETVVNGIRRVLRDDRALHPDRTKRAAYSARLKNQGGA